MQVQTYGSGFSPNNPEPQPTIKNHKKSNPNRDNKIPIIKSNNTPMNQSVVSQSLVLLTTNAADLRMKTKSLKHIITHFKSYIFSVQETHFRKKGRFTHDNYMIFESIRKKEGGGSMLGVHVSLQPVLITEYSDIFELIVVEIKVTDKNIRVITGYGPQEIWDMDVKMKFFCALEEEIAKSATAGKSIILMGDLNSKLGAEYIKKDPKEITENGKILAGILERNALSVVNGMEQKCTGLITRERHTINGVEKSIIDFVIVSEDLVTEVESILIDDKRNHVLTKLTKTKNGIKKTETDHNTIVTKLNVKWKAHEKTYKREIFNLNNKQCQNTFKEDTDKTTQLSNIFDKDDDIQKLTKKFLKRLDGFITKHFKKIRVTDKVDRELEDLYTKKSELNNKTDPISKQKLVKIEEKNGRKIF